MLDKFCFTDEDSVLQEGLFWYHRRDFFINNRIFAPKQVFGHHVRFFRAHYFFRAPFSGTTLVFFGHHSFFAGHVRGSLSART